MISAVRKVLPPFWPQGNGQDNVPASDAITGGGQSMRTSAVLAFALLTIAMPALGSEPCGGSVPCVVPTGRYIALPPPGDLRGVLVFFHGYQSSAERMRRNEALVVAAHRAGFALVLPDGVGGSWSFPNSPSAARDDVAFVGEVLDDIQKRFGAGPRPVIWMRECARPPCLHCF
jgi:polyhydroxybutyrate depolymerase